MLVTHATAPVHPGARMVGMKAIIAPHAGGPDVLTLTTVEPPSCAPDGVVVDVAAAGVNFIDTYQRSGVYSVPYPRVLGLEGAGVVTQVGPEAAWAHVGQRVAWAQTPGSYAQQVALTREACLTVPEAISLDVAAAAMLQGLTAHYLHTSSYPVREGDTVLIHAGAGGVGLLLTQWVTSRGVRAITTVSTAAKEELSRAAGAAAVIRYDAMDNLSVELPAAVRELTAGRGVAAVYDGVGRDTFEASLASLAPRGTMVLFGGASGQVPPFDIQRLNALGSLTLTRPSLGHFLATDAERAWRGEELFTAIAHGTLDVHISARYALADAATAHADLESRRTTGKLLLLP